MQDRIYAFENEVYLCLFHEHAENEREILETLKRSGGFYTLGLMTSIPESMEVLPKILTQKTIDKLVDNMTNFFIHAFDDESFIICTLKK